MSFRFVPKSLTLNSVMAIILHYVVEFDSFRDQLRKSGWLAINRFSPKKCHNVHQLSTINVLRSSQGYYLLLLWVMCFCLTEDVIFWKYCWWVWNWLQMTLNIEPLTHRQWDKLCTLPACIHYQLCRTTDIVSFVGRHSKLYQRQTKLWQNDTAKHSTSSNQSINQSI